MLSRVPRALAQISCFIFIIILHFRFKVKYAPHVVGVQVVGQVDMDSTARESVSVEPVLFVIQRLAAVTASRDFTDRIALNVSQVYYSSTKRLQSISDIKNNFGDVIPWQ